MLRKVLIVDDSFINRQILKNILSESYAVTEAVNGEEAIEFLKSGAVFDAVLLDLFMPVLDGYSVLKYMRGTEATVQIPVIIMTGDLETGTEVKALSLGATDFVVKPYNPEVIKRRLWNSINLRETAAIVNATRVDALTGLLSRSAFFELAEEMISQKEAGYYVMTCFDVNDFKVINDQYGNVKGDEVLKGIAKVFSEGFGKIGGICCRLSADNYAILYPQTHCDSLALINIRRQASELDGTILPLIFSIGRYIVDDKSISANAMLDRAMLAKQTVKGRYDTHIGVYDNSMRDKILLNQEITSEMKTALSSHQFEVWYQPQYNHSTGALVGAEALVRWRHPKKGLIPPSVFIPIFEKNGFIYELDKYVWEECCKNLRKWIDEGKSPVPLSSNVSRSDILREDFVSVIVNLVDKYQLPVELLKLEITESAFAKSTEQIISVVQRLTDKGFVVEIDDFGSGYSSFNTLKDVPAQVLKIDMRFLEGNRNSTRGGNILESIVRMTKWLGMSVIAEGVETVEQADYLRSVGCNYIQGYLYARPMPLEEYEKCAKTNVKEPKLQGLATVNTLNNDAFWSPSSIETLIFNSYIGGACVMEFYEGNLEVLRVNEKYAKSLGGEEMTLEQALTVKWNQYLDKESEKKAIDAINTAIETNKEVSDELVMTGLRGKGIKNYLRANIRVLASAGERKLLYCRLLDITAQREAEINELMMSEQMRAIMQNVSSGITAVTFKDGKLSVKFVNTRFYEIFGYTREQYKNEVKHPFDFINSVEREYVVKNAMKDHSDKPFTVEYSANKRNGEQIWVRIVISTARFQGVDEPVQIGVITDITAEKEAQKKVVESNLQLEFLNGTARELLMKSETESGIENVLQKLLVYFGGTRAFIYEYNYEKNICSHTYEACASGVAPRKDEFAEFSLDVAKYWLKVFEKSNHFTLKEGDVLGDDRRTEKAVYERLGAHSAIAVALHSEEKVIGTIGVFNPTRSLENLHNIDALGDYVSVILVRRDLSAKVRSDKAALENIMKDIPGGFTRLQILDDGTMKAVYANITFCQMLGYSQEELEELYFDNNLSLVHPDELDYVKSMITQLKEEDSRVSGRYRMKHKSGDWVDMKVLWRMSENDVGERFINIYYVEVSEQDKEDDSRKRLIEYMPCGMGVYEFFDNQVSTVFVNDRFCELVERSRDEICKENSLDAVLPADRALLINAITETVILEKRSEADIHILDGNCGYRPFHLNGNVVRQNDGKATIYVTYTPVSETELSFREMIPIALGAVMASSTELSFVKDRNFNYICCSREFAKMVGFEDEKDIQGKSDFDIFGKELAEKYRADDITLMASGKSLVDYVEIIPSDDNTVHYSSTSKYLLRDSDGNNIGVYGTGRDITEEREAYTRLKLLTDNIPGCVSMYEVSINGVRSLYVSEGISKMTGYGFEEYKEITQGNPLYFVFKEDLPILKTQIKAVMSGQKNLDCTYRMVTKDGGYTWINLRGLASENNGGRTIVQCVLFDVTAQKTTEIKLLSNRTAIDIASKNSGISFWLYNLDDKSVRHDAFQTETVLGYDAVIENCPQYFVDKGVLDPSGVDAFVKMHQEIIDGAQSGECTVQIKNLRSGNYEWQRFIYTRLDDEVYNGRFAIGFSINVDHEQENRQRYEHELQLRRELIKNSVTYYQLNLTASVVEEYHSSFADVDKMTDKIKITAKVRENILKNIAPEDKERVRNTIFSDALKEAYLRGENNLEMSYRRIVGNEGLRWVKTTATLMQRPNTGEIIAFVHSVDVDRETKDRIAVESIMGEEIESVVVLNIKTATAHYVKLTSDGNYCSSNEDYDFNEVFYEKIVDKIIADDVSGSKAFFNVDTFPKRLETEHILKFTYRIMTDKGLARKKIRAFYVDDLKNEIILIRRDITDLYEEEQRQKQALQKAVDEATAANNAKSDFLSRMSHDMRTPLNAVLSFSDNIMTQDAETEQLRSYLKKIHASGDYLLGIINDILDMSKIEQKKVTLHPTPYLLDDFVETMNTVIGELSKDKGIDFVVKVKSAADCVYVDKIRFNQIFINLLSNAVKFTPSGGKVELIIENYGKKTPNSIASRFIVRDTGIGMSPEFIPHAFESFMQEYRDDVSENSKGTGLGLAIVKQIVELMNGTVTLESELNKGTTFVVEIPFVTADAEAAKIANDQPETMLKGMKILMCEDNAINTEIALNLLGKQGCIVDCADDGKKGLDKFLASAEGYYDAVLMDIRMPIMNGLEVAKAIRASERTDAKSIAIIAMTADTFNEDEHSSRQAGMDAHLFKPIKADILYSTLKHVVKR